MKRIDAFFLGLTAFVAANCASYFVHSGAPYVTGWEARPGVHGLFEAAGFPFIAFHISFGGIAPSFGWSWVIWLANAVVAIVASFVCSFWLANRLPPFWPTSSRALHFSLRELLGVVTVVGVVLGVGLMSKSAGLVARNIVCIGGPIAVYVWSLARRQHCWAAFFIAAIGLTLLTLALDLKYAELPMDQEAVVRALRPIPDQWVGLGARDATPYMIRHYLAVTVVRAIVPVFGLLSSLILAPVVYTHGKTLYHRCQWRPRDDDGVTVEAESE